MSVDLAGFTAPDPVFTASGCAAAGRELAAFNDLTAIGGVVTKSIQLAARSGRPTPRMAETPSGMLNSIGLRGPGIDAFLQNDLAWLAGNNARAVVSVAGSSVDDYAKLAARLRGHPVDLIEANISCPNVEDRGQVFACDPDAAAAVVSAVRRAAPTHVPVFAKLSPDVTDIVAIARACVDAGADGLSLINTTLGIVIDTQTMRPALAGITGGLSGPAIRPLALHRHLSRPVRARAHLARAARGACRARHRPAPRRGRVGASPPCAHRAGVTGPARRRAGRRARAAERHHLRGGRS